MPPAAFARPPWNCSASIGYEQTTVAAIAERAGLTARTFFRYFADKREVLFDGSERLAAMMVDASPRRRPARRRSTPSPRGWRHRPSSRRTAPVLAPAQHGDRRQRGAARARAGQDRSGPAALAGALRARGVGEPDAGLDAATGIAMFRVAFARWVHEDDEAWTLTQLLNDSFAQLRAVTAPA